MSIDAREFKRIVRLAIEAGWRVEYSKAGAGGRTNGSGAGRRAGTHALVYPPDPTARPVGFSTSGDWRALRNTYGAFRALGLELDPTRLQRAPKEPRL